MDIKFYKEQSAEANHSLNESIIAADISTTDEIISVVIDEKITSSIVYKIAEVQPIHGPTAAHFSVQYDEVTNKTSVVRTNITVEADALEQTGFTIEAAEDMYAQYGKSSIKFFGKTFAGVSAKNENTKLLLKMSTWAFADTQLTLTNIGNAETTMFEIAKKVGDSIVKMNSKKYRTLDSFVVLPQNVAGAVLGLSNYFSEGVEHELFIGRTSRISYYINPDPLSTTCFVGLNGKIPGSSAIIFSPYQHTLSTAVDPATGNENIVGFNRYAMSLNSLSTAGNEMITKFLIA